MSFRERRGRVPSKFATNALCMNLLDVRLYAGQLLLLTRQGSTGILLYNRVGPFSSICFSIESENTVYPVDFTTLYCLLIKRELHVYMCGRSPW